MKLFNFFKKQELFFPSYDGNGIVNLISSIEKSRGGNPKYPELKILPAKELSSKNVVLMILDGTGYEYLTNQGKETFLSKNIKGKITSVLPAGTSSVLSSIYSGSSPIQTGVTGWYIFLRELGVIVESITFSAKFSKESLSRQVKINKLFNFTPVSKRIKTKFFHVNNKEYCYAPFSSSFAKKSEILPYKNLDEFFKQTEKAIKKNGKKYIISYYPEPDSSMHTYGTKSKIPLKKLKEIDTRLKKFLEKIKNTDTTLIITADHGLKDTTNRINFETHPKLKDMLIMPMTGESGVAYCYVKNSKKRYFEKYVKTKMKYICEIHPSQELVKRGYFGKGEIHPELLNRIGDYTLLMRGKYASGFKLINSSNHENLGGHGGATKEEMFVPLIVIKARDLK